MELNRKIIFNLIATKNQEIRLLIEVFQMILWDFHTDAELVYSKLPYLLSEPQENVCILIFLVVTTEWRKMGIREQYKAQYLGWIHFQSSWEVIYLPSNLLQENSIWAKKCDEDKPNRKKVHLCIVERRNNKILKWSRWIAKKEWREGGGCNPSGFH